MNVWLAAAIALLPALGGCAVVAVGSGLADRLVALELATVIAVFALMLLIVAFDQPSFIDLALTLALLSLPGSLVYAHFIERWL
ncbi:MAG TPA: monovalent cation/H+ antiporter complex subunit F [Stellaceae bacterium]|nr:monovalent cation/H+ antiporter complex subunit F [Stellaceae bacterium]